MRMRLVTLPILPFTHNYKVKIKKRKTKRKKTRRAGIARLYGRRMKFHISAAVNMVAVTRTIRASAREANGQRRSRPTP